MTGKMDPSLQGDDDSEFDRLSRQSTRARASFLALTAIPALTAFNMSPAGIESTFKVQETYNVSSGTAYFS